MYFEILGDIADAETIATGSSIREVARLRKFYGRGRWRKRKGVARVRLETGEVRLAGYTGTKLTESDVKSSRSSTTLTDDYAIQP
jgi:hypothetical protein